MNSSAQVPHLEIDAFGTGFELSWDSNLTGFELEESARIGPGAAWSSVSTPPVLQGGRQVVPILLSGAQRFFRLKGAEEPSLTKVALTSPLDGERGVAVTRETIFYLSAPLGPQVVVAPGDAFAEFGGRRLLTRTDLSSDRRKITVFYLENLPGGARIQVSLDGERLVDASGAALDSDNDGTPGGVRVLRFDTFGTTALPNTGVEGRVFAAARNTDGTDRPLRHVTITVDGAEETLRTTTDANGYFRLLPAPAGRFFVHVDGRTAEGSAWPEGAYYPFVGKAWEATPGKTNNLAGGNGIIYLPLIQNDALRPVSASEATRVTPSPTAIADRPDLAGLEILVPANSLFADNGVRGGRVGVAPVPADRLPEPLPPGLNLPLAITIQTDGGLNFDQPVPVRFPNLPDPVTGVRLPPGAKTVLWSFNHDTGRWEPQGTMTISADGAFADSDPGTGVRQPGWAGVGPGTPLIGPGRAGGSGGGFGGFGSGGGGGGGGGEGPPDDECTRDILCRIPQPERRWLNCVLKCARDLLTNPFSRPKPKRSPIESGLRCIGGPDKCAGSPDDTLTPGQRACMDSCQQPEPLYVRYVVPCEGGFLDPCPEEGGAASRSLSSLPPGGQWVAAADGSDAELLPDRLVEQRRFWEVEADYFAKLAGTPKFVQMSNADLPSLSDFLDALADRVQPASEFGIHLSPAERAFLVGMPRPAHFTAEEWAALVDRFDSLQGAALPPEVAAARERLENLIDLLKERGWTRRLDGFVQGYARLSASRAPLRGSEEFPARAHYFHLRNLETGEEIRGRLTDSGYFPDLVVPPDQVFSVAYLDPVTGHAGAALFVSRQTGALSTAPSAPLEELDAAEVDTDGDGLADTSEEIVGTSVVDPDTDDDGVPDGAEISSDANPLDGIAEGFGYLAGIPLGQGAREIRVEDDLAVIRDASTGLVFVDLSDPLKPVIAGRLGVSDSLLSLAAQGRLALLGGSMQSSLVDFANPSAPKVVWTRPQRGYQAAITFGRAYLAGDDALVAYDLESGLQVETVRHPHRVLHLQALGDGLAAYSIVSGGTFELLRLAQGGDQLDVAGRLPDAPDCDGCGWGMFVEPSYAYLATVRGYEVVDIRNPSGMVRLARQGPVNTGGGAIAKDSGNRLVMGTFVSAAGLSDASIFDASEPTVSSNFVAGLGGVSGTLTHFVIHRGRLFATVEEATDDKKGGLEVLGYRNRDTGTNPPSLNLRASTLQAAPLAEQSLGWFRLLPRAADDVAVRNVEIYLDGVRVADSGSHPFEVNLRAPELSASKTNFTVRARAFDTGGNSAWSETLTIGIVPEVRAPRLLAFTPPSGIAGLTGTVFSVTARFNERLAPSSLAAGLLVRSAGPDGDFGTADDLPVPSTAVERTNFQYRLDLGQPLSAGSYQVLATTNALDLFGNRLFNPTNWTFLVREPIAWVGTASGDWGSAERWTESRLPEVTDFVRILAPATTEVTLQRSLSGNWTAYDLRSTATMILQPGASLELQSEGVFAGPVRSGAGGDGVAVGLGGGRLVIEGPLDLTGSLILQDHHLVLDGPGDNMRFSDASLTFMAYTKALGSRLTVQAGTEVNVSQSSGSLGIWNVSDLASSVENLGVLRKHGAGIWRLAGQGTLQNQGTIVVEEGEFSVGAGVFENLATVEIHAGATFQSGRLFPPTRHARTARVTGAGTNLISNASVYEALYDFSGTTHCENGAEFRGGVRSDGTWIVRANGFTVRGLEADFSGPLFVGGVTPAEVGRMQLYAARETVFRDVRRLNALITGSGRLRITSPLVISNLAGFATANNSPFSLQFDGPVRLAGRREDNQFLRATAPGIDVRFANRVDWVSGPIEVNTNSIILPGAEWVVDGPEFTEITGAANQAGLQVRGTYRKAGPGTNRVQRLVNVGGLVEVSGGVLQSLVEANATGYVQTGGELRLGGGTLDIRLGNHSSSIPGRIEILGGEVSGSGDITGDVTVTAGTLAPAANAGATSGILKVNGQLNLGSGARFKITLAGTTPGTGHDQIVASTCEFGGGLEVSLDGGFVPQVGQEFSIATFENRGSSQFQQVTGPNLPSGRRLEVIYEAKALKLRVVP